MVEVSNNGLAIANYRPGLSRAERRAADKQRRRQIKTPHANTPINVAPIHQVLEHEEDGEYLEAQLEDYKGAQRYTELGFQLYSVYRSCGASENTLRDFFLPGAIEVQGILNKLSLEANPTKFAASAPLLQTLLNSIFRTKKGFQDEDEDLIVSIMRDEPVSLGDIFKEILRYRRENIELLGLQIDWLNGQDKAAETPKGGSPSYHRNAHLAPISPQAEADNQEVEISVPAPSVENCREDKILEEPFSLSAWRLFWTDRYWSSEDSHLTEVSTSSREELTKGIAKLGEAQISIKPGSIARALEFHLINKDVIQRGLAARLRYGSQDAHQWMKVKRGKDRIGIFVPTEPENVAIFFAAGRDEVYRSL